MALVLAVLLPIDLCAQSSAPLTPKQQIIKQPPQTRLDLKLVSGQKVTGNLVSTDENGFILTTGSKSAPTQRTVAYSDVSKVTAHRPTHTPLAAWIGVGAIVAVVVMVVAVFAAERHNEGG